MLNMLAFDYGASSGRAVMGSFDGSVLGTEEIHRFSNDPVLAGGTLYWDILRLFHEMKQGLLKSRSHNISSIGIDSWAVDFGLIDENGKLIGNPVHYRDSRAEGTIEEIGKIVDRREIYEKTGIAFMVINTLNQLYAINKKEPSMLDNAKALLFIPDLLAYFLTGFQASEFTVASTSQMLNSETRQWDKDLLGAMGINTSMLKDIVEAGSILGPVNAQVQNELGIGPIPLISVGEHDTASAVVAVPAKDENYAYLSSGTWSLLGIELKQPIINDVTYSLNYTNEGGISGTTRLLKNIMGLWIYQECKRKWDSEGNTLSFDELEQKAAQKTSFKSFIDPDDIVFFGQGNMPGRVRAYCKDSGQPVPEDKFEIVRCIMESLALKYRVVIEGLEAIIGRKINVLHIVGGGCKNKMLNQFTANAIGKTVVTGPTEATAIGNLLCQLIGLGELKGLGEARELVLNSFETEIYQPEEKAAWDDAYEKFKMFVNRG
jgi:rhamnulokinase